MSSRLRELEQENAQLKEEIRRLRGTTAAQPYHTDSEGLGLEEYRRYGRQMIVPEFGSLPSQLKMKGTSILVIGAGGLGCPALMYLAAAGVGRIGIVDDDVVDESNLHRQVLHTTESVGMYKCRSAKRYLSKLNPHVKIDTYPHRLTNSNAFGIVPKYDIVVDCTDTPATRYLINDVSVLSGKPIVSASGLKVDGQLTVLNYANGPCYRCFYPTPPNPNSVTTCADGGVLGPAIGLMGVAMALEVIKVIIGYPDFKPFLAQYSGFPQQTLRIFKMRGRQKTCAVCGDHPTVTRNSIENNTIDYAAFCGRVNPNVLEPKDRLLPREFAADQSGLVIDVRPVEQFMITKLPGLINIPWEQLQKRDIKDLLPEVNPSDRLTVVCRYGNDSQAATKKLQEHFTNVKDIKGGLFRWSDDVDPTLPKY